MIERKIVREKKAAISSKYIDFFNLHNYGKIDALLHQRLVFRFFSI
jgi:hypothetical protein